MAFARGCPFNGCFISTNSSSMAICPRVVAIAYRWILDGRETGPAG
jgi:hypothetical protein